MSQANQLLELRTATGKLLDRAFPLDFALENSGHFTFKRNKRNNITSIRLKLRFSTQPLTNAGLHYLEKLATGHALYALRGTPGARPAPIV